MGEPFLDGVLALVIQFTLLARFIGTKITAITTVTAVAVDEN